MWGVYDAVVQLIREKYGGENELGVEDRMGVEWQSTVVIKTSDS